MVTPRCLQPAMRLSGCDVIRTEQYVQKHTVCSYKSMLKDTKHIEYVGHSMWFWAQHISWLWQPAETPGSSHSWPRNSLAPKNATMMLLDVQIKETRYNVLIKYRHGQKNDRGLFYPGQTTTTSLRIFWEGCGLEHNQSGPTMHLSHYCFCVIGCSSSQQSNRPTRMYPSAPYDQTDYDVS